MPSLLILTGARRGERLLLQGDRIVLGREAGCDVAINGSMVEEDDPRAERVSRRHAVIVRVGAAYYIEDGGGLGTGSRNGTRVNDRAVSLPRRVPLRDGDHIRLGSFDCTFHEDEEADVSVEASLGHESSIHSLQAQPAERLRVILEISNGLSRTLDVDALLPRIVEGLFQIFRQAERGFVLLRDGGTGPPLVRVFKTRQPGKGADDRFSASIVRRCLDSVEAILGNDLPREFPESSSITDLPIRSLMCAPLWSQDGRALGAIQLDARTPRTRFTEDDLSLLLGVASQASIALCNARLHREALANEGRRRALEVAQRVQRALLPQQLPDVPGYEFHAHYEPAREVGGDYYDFIPLPRQRLAVLLGDVVGKDVPAALVMAKFSVEARVCLEAEPDLTAAVTRLDAVMARANLPDRFVTLAAVVLDPATHTATLVNAGHPSPLLLRHATGEVVPAAPPGASGPPVGIAGGHAYATCEVRLLPGDSLLLFSDGVTEAMDAQRRQFGTRGVHGVLEGQQCSPREAGERLIEAVKRHAAGCGQHDDITLVSFGRAVGDPQECPPDSTAPQG